MSTVPSVADPARERIRMLRIAAGIEPEQMALSAPKREFDKMAKDDLATWALLIRRMPVALLMRILLNEGDPIIRVREWIRLTLKDEPRHFARAIAVVRETQKIDAYWQHFVRECFPKVTRLPPSVQSWHDMARRILDLVASTTVTPENESGGPTPVVQNPEIPVFAEWPAARLRMQESITCGQFFNQIYNLKVEILEEQGRIEEWTPTVHIVSMIVSEQYVNRRDEDTHLLRPEIGLDVDIVLPDYDTDWGSHEQLGDEWDGWQRTYHYTETQTYSGIDVEVDFRPSFYVTDALFDTIDARLGSDRYTPPPGKASLFWENLHM